MLFYATCVALGDQVVLLTGASGCGKSDVALRLIDAGAQLVADDQVELRVVDGALTAFAPQSIAGMFEARHVGLLRLPYRASAPVALCVALEPMETILERLPEAENILLLDHPVRHLRLPAYAASTPAKIGAALRFPLVTDLE